MLSGSSKTHQVFFSAVAEESTSKFNKQYNNWRYYFSLKETNRLLVEENARLHNALKSNFVSSDTSILLRVDTLMKDSLGRARKYSVLPAKVIGNTLSMQNNYITLERGSLQGVYKGMAVISATGIVGVVVAVSDNNARVMSLLHRSSSVSAMLKKDNSAGSIEWDGADPTYLILKNIPKSSKVIKGDSVLTSTYSSNFPSHLMIGTVSSIVADPSSNFFTLKVKTATNFFALQYAYLIKNTGYAEQTAIENRTEKN